MVRGYGHPPAKGPRLSRPATSPTAPPPEPFSTWYEQARRYGLASRIPEGPLEDALGDAWRIHRKTRKKFTSAKHLARWVRRRALWKYLDWLRRARRTISLEAHDWAADDSRSLPADEGGWTFEETRAVRLCLRRLPVLERKVLAAHLRGLTDREIAELLWANTSDAANLRVWRLRQKALERLRRLLEMRGIF